MIYDYKSKSTVQDVILDGIDKLTDDIEDEFASLRRYQYLLIYSPAFLAREIIGEILDDEDDVWINEDANFELLHDDDNEVIVSLGHDGMIFIESARSRSGELKISEFSALTYVYDGFSKKDVDYLSSEGDSVLVFGFTDNDEEYTVDGIKTTKEEFDKYVDKHINNDSGEDSDDENDEDPCEECCNNCNCFCDEDEDGNVHGFSVSKTDENGYMSCSYYSSEGFDEDDMRDILELLGYRFKD